MALLDAFRRHLVSLQPEAGAAVVAVSGGPDSVALLDLLAHTVETHRLKLTVAHFDHGIHAESPEVAERVAALAAGYAFPFESGSATLGPSATETSARQARYDWLEAIRRRLRATCIVTAHHADDQAETVLMRVLGGSGPAGLAGIAARSGYLLRPLLPFRKVELEAYVVDAGLQCWVDPANRDHRHERSWLRTNILPTLRDRLPQIDARLARVASLAARDRAAWDALLDVLPALEFRTERDGVSVAATLLARYDSPLAQTLAAAAARRAGLTLGAARADRVVELCRSASSGTRAQLGGGWIAELAFGRLRLARQELTAHGALDLAGDAGHARWGGWRLVWRREPAPAHHPRLGGTAWFPPGQLTVRTWTPGERVRPVAGTGSRPIARCFQEAAVPRSRRAGWPVVYRGGAIVWVPGICRAEAQLPESGTEALRVDAELA